MTKPKAINRKKLVAFVLSIITKGVDPMPNEKLEKLKHDQYVAERMQQLELPEEWLR